jgi:hypothetical protein
VFRLFLHLFLIALVAGLAAASSAAGRVTWTLVASTTMCWAFVPMLQALTGTIVLLSGPRRPPFFSALADWLALHRSWSVFVIVTAAVLMFVPSLRIEAALPAAILPGVLTARTLIAFAVAQLGDSRRSAVRRIALHQFATAVLLFAYLAWGVALPPRVIAWLQ